METSNSSKFYKAELISVPNYQVLIRYKKKVYFKQISLRLNLYNRHGLNTNLHDRTRSKLLYSSVHH